MSTNPRPQTVAPNNNWATSFTVTPEQQKSLFHYMFVAVDGSGGVLPGGGIDVHENINYFGIRSIDRGRFTLIKNKGYRDHRAAIGGGDDELVDTSAGDDMQAFVVGVRDRVCYASEIAARLEKNYWDQYGVICVAPLIGMPEAVARWVESLLLPRLDVGFAELKSHIEAFDLDTIQPPHSPQWQGWLQYTGTDVRALVDAVRMDLLRSCSNGEAFGQTYYSDYVSEMRTALMPGRGGVSVISPKLRLLCKEFGFPTPDDLAKQAQSAQATQQSAPMEIKIPGLEDLIKLLATQGLQIVPAVQPPNAPADLGPQQGVDNWEVSSQLPATPVPEVIAGDGAEKESELVDRSITEKVREEQPFGLQSEECSLGPTGDREKTTDDEQDDRRPTVDRDRDPQSGKFTKRT